MNLKLLKKKLNGELEKGNKNKWDAKFWKNAKDQLLSETSGKCAYCETPTSVVAYGDVEHFRPKSKYWWLAYCYDNYLASCAVCNQKFKSDEFLLRDDSNKLAGPSLNSNMTEKQLREMAALLTVDPVVEEEGMKYDLFEDALQSEWALLVHPYYEDPSEYYAYLPILKTKEVHVVPTKPEYGDVVEAAELLFGVNRTELLSLRFQWYLIYMTYRYSIAEAGISENIRASINNRIMEMLTGKLQYTGMIKYFETKKLHELLWDFSLVS